MARGSFWARRLIVATLLSGCGGATASKGPGDAGEGGGAGSQTGQACPGAPDAEGGGRRCRSRSECAENEVCQAYLPHDCVRTGSTCHQDSACETGQVCAETGVSSCFGGSQIRACGEPCSEGSCAPGSSCGADGHCQPVSCLEGHECSADQVCGEQGTGDEHGCRVARCDQDAWSCPGGHECQPGEEANEHGCVPISCTTGFACPANHRCVSDSLYVHAHQCELLKCQRDADCDCGYCIEGVCRDVLSYCAPPPIG